MSVQNNNHVINAAGRFEDGPSASTHEVMNSGPEGRGPIVERQRIVEAGVHFAIEAVRAQKPELVPTTDAPTTAGHLAQVVKLSIESDGPEQSSQAVDQVDEQLSAIGYVEDRAA